MFLLGGLRHWHLVYLINSDVKMEYNVLVMGKPPMLNNVMVC